MREREGGREGEREGGREQKGGRGEGGGLKGEGRREGRRRNCQCTCGIKLLGVGVTEVGCSWGRIRLLTCDLCTSLQPLNLELRKEWSRLIC